MGNMVGNYLVLKNEEKYGNAKDHNWPMFTFGIVWNKPITEVTVDNGSMVNIVLADTLINGINRRTSSNTPTWSYKALNKMNKDRWRKFLPRHALVR